MALNFPNSPTDGQIYETFRWNAAATAWDSIRPVGFTGSQGAQGAQGAAGVLKGAVLEFSTTTTLIGEYIGGAPAGWTVSVGAADGSLVPITVDFSTATLWGSLNFQGYDSIGDRYVLRPLLTTINPYTNVSFSQITVSLSRTNVGAQGAAGNCYLFITYWEFE